MKKQRLLIILLLLIAGTYILGEALTDNEERTANRDSETDTERTKPDMSQENAHVFNVKDYGAAGDGEGDDLAAIRKAVNDAKDIENSVVVFPYGKGYNVSDYVHIPAHISVEQHAPIIYTGNENKPVLVIGERDKTSRATYEGLSVIREKSSGWEKEDPYLQSIGIQMINVYNSEIEINEVRNFTIGAQLLGSGKGFAYNNVNLGFLGNNYIQLDLTNQDGGWTNENVFTGGRFANWSSTHRDQSRYGVRITSKNRQYRNNNNVFLKPSFELKQHGDHETIPILIEHGSKNHFQYIRHESNGKMVARVLNKSSDNFISLGFGSGKVDDQSIYPTTVLESSTSRLMKQYNSLLAKYNLRARMSVEDGKVRFKGLDIKIYTTGHNVDEAPEDSFVKKKYNVEFERKFAVGKKMDTSRNKSFVIKRAVSEGGNGGRVVVIGYDENGDVVDGSKNKWLRTTEYKEAYWRKNYGGAFFTGTDSSSPFYFHVSEEVKEVWIGVTGLSANQPAAINSFGIFTRSDQFSPY
ncbi:glycoside hydrolase family 55 protein [Bacillus tianshenii]|nr:glycoside hydrolase family 55 protein [Bacillus tianshenii]